MKFDCSFCAAQKIPAGDETEGVKSKQGRTVRGRGNRVALMTELIEHALLFIAFDEMQIEKYELSWADQNIRTQRFHGDGVGKETRNGDLTQCARPQNLHASQNYYYILFASTHRRRCHRMCVCAFKYLWQISHLRYRANR